MSKIASSLSVPVAIYARVSTSKQVGGRFDSCESQVVVCRDFIGRNASLGWVEAAEFVDAGYTGANVSRPGIEALKREIVAGRIKVVVVFKMERVLRSTEEWAPLRALLKKHGCDLVSVTEDLEDETPSGRLKTNLIVSFSEYARQNDREKSISKQREQAKRGFWRGGLDGYGYDNDSKEKRLKLNIDESKIVREIFQRAAKLESLTAISNDLTQRGVRTKVRVFKRRDQQKVTVGGRSIRSDWLRALVQNPLYRGIVRSCGEEYVGQHEAIVTPELWSAANAAIAEKKKLVRILPGRDKHDNLLKGYLICGCCGTALVPHASGKLDASGKPYRYYVCHRQIKERSGSRCTLRQIAGPAIERSVIAVLGRLSRSREVVAATLTAGQARGQSQQEPLEKRLKATTREIECVAHELRNLASALAKDGLDALSDELRESAARLKCQKNSLSVEREGIEQELDVLRQETIAPEKVCAALSRFDALWEVMTRDEQRELVSLMIVRVEVRATAIGGQITTRDIGVHPEDKCIQLRIQMHLPELLESVDAATVYLRKKKFVVLKAKVSISAGSGSIRILEPIQESIEPSSMGPAPVVHAHHEHLIHRALRWQKLLAGDEKGAAQSSSLGRGASGGGLSLRQLARNEKLSAATVSKTLRLLDLTPQIRKVLLQITEAKQIYHLGLRRLMAIARLPAAQQEAAFRVLCSEILK